MRPRAPHPRRRTASLPVTAQLDAPVQPDTSRQPPSAVQTVQLAAQPSLQEVSAALHFLTHAGLTEHVRALAHELSVAAQLDAQEVAWVRHAGGGTQLPVSPTSPTSTTASDGLASLATSAAASATPRVSSRASAGGDFPSRGLASETGSKSWKSYAHAAVCATSKSRPRADVLTERLGPLLRAER
jgi:hypothetical protein